MEPGKQLRGSVWISASAQVEGRELTLDGLSFVTESRDSAFSVILEIGTAQIYIPFLPLFTILFLSRRLVGLV